LKVTPELLAWDIVRSALIGLIHERENAVFTGRKQADAVAQTFLSAGSRDIPVP
jgi:hypothetical protein